MVGGRYRSHLVAALLRLFAAVLIPVTYGVFAAMKSVFASFAASILIASVFVLPTSAAEATLDPALKENCIKACNECLRSCRECLVSCDCPNCEKHCLTCLETCRACVALMEYEAPLSGAMCGLCAKACENCAAECLKCGDMPCCKKCAEACQKCLATCKAMAK